MATTIRSRWTRLRPLGPGASGAVVMLAVAADASGELFVVKSAGGAARASQLRREWGVLSGLFSPQVIRCLGFRSTAGGDSQLFLEFAPGGSLADVVARNGGRLQEDAVRSYAADVVRGLAYIHGKAVVHGDVKGSNVVVGADGQAKLVDFGCARTAGSGYPVGGTPAFMAPEVARGEEQGPAADVWALGCTVIEMATGCAPWSDMDDDVMAAVHRIGYTEAVPEVPRWLSPEAKDFLDRCLRRRACDRWTAARLLEHPFVASGAGCGAKAAEEAEAKWVSPTSALDAAFWELETDDEADDISESPTSRIKTLACPRSALPDWDADDECWIQVLGDEFSETPAERVRTLACFRSALPDWDADDEGWIQVLGTGAVLDELSETPVERFRALACSRSAMPDWDADEDWIEVCDTSAVTAEEMAGVSMSEGLHSVGVSDEPSAVISVNVLSDASSEIILQSSFCSNGLVKLLCWIIFFLEVKLRLKKDGVNFF